MSAIAAMCASVAAQAPAPGSTTQVSRPGNGAAGKDGTSGAASISATGRYVAFWSEASNLVAGDTNRVGDVFVRDLVTGSTVRASVSSTEVQGNRASGAERLDISADGRFVAFTSRATNLVARDTNRSLDIFVRDVVAGTTRRVSVSSTERQARGSSQDASISGDGRYVAFMSEAANRRCLRRPRPST